MKPPTCVQVCAALQGADVVLTLLAVEVLGHSELNPVVRGLLEQGIWGIMAFVGLKVGTIALLVYMRDLSDHRLVVLMRHFAMGYVLLLSSAALIWNLGQLL